MWISNACERFGMDLSGHIGSASWSSSGSSNVPSGLGPSASFALSVSASDFSMSSNVSLLVASSCLFFVSNSCALLRNQKP